MSLKQRLQDDMKTALRAKESTMLSTIRLAIAEIKRFETDKMRTEADDAQIIAILTKMVKQRKDSAKIYTEAQRIDLAEKELAEIEILNRYLPQMLSESDIQTEVHSIITQTGFSSPTQMGKIMSLLKTRLAGKADMREVNRIVKAILTK